MSGYCIITCVSMLPFQHNVFVLSGWPSFAFAKMLTMLIRIQTDEKSLFFVLNAYASRLRLLPAPPVTLPSEPSFLSNPTLNISEMSGNGNFLFEPTTELGFRVAVLELWRLSLWALRLARFATSTRTSCEDADCESSVCMLSPPAENWNVVWGRSNSAGLNCVVSTAVDGGSDMDRCSTCSTVFPGDKFLVLCSGSNASSSLSLWFRLGDPSYLAVAHSLTLHPSPSCNPKFSWSRNWRRSSSASW